MVYVLNNKCDYYVIGNREDNKVCYLYLEIFVRYFIVLDYLKYKLI